VRVTGGEARGTSLQSPQAPGVRPTTDRVRSALFNILAAEGIENTTVIDLYAGTGSLGIEALSRGAAHADFVEADRRQVAVVRANLKATKTADRANVIQSTVENALARLRTRYDFILMDPPYKEPFPTAVVKKIGDLNLLAEEGLAIVGHATREKAPERCGRLVRTQDRRYGDSSLAFYAVTNSEETAGS
jgi:16S rRNA (guanine966-N2)-methyltransferase